MKDKKVIGYEIHTLDNMIGRLVTYYQAGINGKEDLTQMQCWIIGFLYRNSERDLFQKDVEAEFHIAGSTATGILKLMEKKGFISRQPFPTDARLKRLVLTQKGIDLQHGIMESFERTEETLKSGVSPEDLDIFYKVIRQIRSNTCFQQDITK